MLRKYSLLLLLFASLITVHPLRAQESHKDNEPGKDLVLALSKVVRLPRSIMAEGSSYAFALKFVFSEKGIIDAIVSSKYAPKEIKSALIQPDQYKHVSWERIFNRKVGKGDILIVPVSIYNPESSKMLPEYNVDDLFNFSTQKEAEKFTPCLVMQTVVFQYKVRK